jgi:hypothetical protein
MTSLRDTICDAQLAGDEVEVFSSKEAKEGSTLAIGREAAAVGLGHRAYYWWCPSGVRGSSGTPQTSRGGLWSGW